MWLLYFAASIAAQYHVTKYPTLKLFRFGTVAKREYRGQRSVDAILNYIREQVKSTIQEVKNLEDLDTLDVSNPNFNSMLVCTREIIDQSILSYIGV